MAPFILNSDDAWSDSSTSCTYYSPAPPPQKKPCCAHWLRRRVGSKSRSRRRFGVGTKLFPLPVIEPRFLGCPSCSLGTRPTSLSGSHLQPVHKRNFEPPTGNLHKMSSHILLQNIGVPWRHLCCAAILKVQKYNLHELTIVALKRRSYHDEMTLGICKSLS